MERLSFDKSALMHMWRFAVITYLRAALQVRSLKMDMNPLALNALLVTQYERWWNIDIDHFKSKTQFLRYAGRLCPPATDRSASFYQYQ